MNRDELLRRLAQLNIDPGEYWLITGGAMVLYGLRPETGDIDLGCTRKLADRLQAQGCPVSMMPDGTRKLSPETDVEIFEEWRSGEVVLVDGVPVVTLQGLIDMKRQIGRGKDLRDIRLIEARLEEQA